MAKLDDIIMLVCHSEGVTKAEMLSQSRKRRVARPRQMVMKLAREFTRLSLPQIGKRLGDRDHTTVLHGGRVITNLESHIAYMGDKMSMMRKILRGETVAEEMPVPPTSEDIIRKTWKSSASLTLVDGRY